MKKIKKTKKEVVNFWMLASVTLQNNKVREILPITRRFRIVYWKIHAGYTYIGI